MWLADDWSINRNRKAASLFEHLATHLLEPQRPRRGRLKSLAWQFRGHLPGNSITMRVSERSCRRVPDQQGDYLQQRGHTLRTKVHTLAIRVAELAVARERLLCQAARRL